MLAGTFFLGFFRPFGLSTTSVPFSIPGSGVVDDLMIIVMVEVGSPCLDPLADSVMTPRGLVKSPREFSLPRQLGREKLRNSQL